MKYSWVSVDKDGVVSTAPAFISSLILTPDSTSNNADVTLYDGESTRDPLLTVLRSGDGVSLAISFDEPLETRRGLYVDIGSNVTNLLIQIAWNED